MCESGVVERCKGFARDLNGKPSAARFVCCGEGLVGDVDSESAALLMSVKLARRGEGGSGDKRGSTANVLLDASRLNVMAGLMDRLLSDLVLGTFRAAVPPTGPTPKPIPGDCRRDVPAGERLGDDAVLLRELELAGPGDDRPPSALFARGTRLYDPSDGL